MQEAHQRIQNALKDVYPENELKSISRLLLSKITGLSYTGLLINKNTNFSDKQNELLNYYLSELEKNKPIQYVLGETEFCGLPLQLSESVLIPRPETEELVEWIVGENKSAQKALDIGTGSGCIALSLKHFLPHLKMFACDISEPALQIAAQNATRCQSEISFFQLNILNDTLPETGFDIIVSNPPYIPLGEIPCIHARVWEHEPHIALFVDDHNPLVFYQKIAESAQKALNKQGKLYFEVHRDFAEDVCDMLHNAHFQDIVSKRDIHGNVRMVRCSR